MRTMPVRRSRLFQRGKRGHIAEIHICAYFSPSFLTRPRNLFFSSVVWKRPWPHLEAVSTNLRLICSREGRFSFGWRVLRRVTTRHLGPATPPLIMSHSWRTWNCTRAGCQEPMHATLRRPRWDLRARRCTPQRETTPSKPLPLVVPITSIISSWENTSATLTSCSKRPVMKSTLSLVLPPLTWISLMCAFFCPILTLATCVWQIARITWQYFFARSSSAAIGEASAALLASPQRFWYLVKAFCLDLCQAL